MQHRWMTLGTSGMTNEQAQGWAGVAGTGPGIREESLDVFFSAVVCVVCRENYGEALPECLGLPTDEKPNEHFWQAFFTHPVTDDQAAAWADPEGDMDLGLPQSIALVCMLCGQDADTADAECSVRTFWTKNSEIDLDPSDFASMSELDEEPMMSKEADQGPSDPRDIKDVLREVNAESAVEHRTRLCRADQLPDLEAEYADIIVTEEWRDFSDAPELEGLDQKLLPCFVVRARTQELWIEVASYESWKRLPELKRLLKKYGAHMNTFTPPPSGTFTYGDDLGSPEKLREALRQI